MAMHQPETHIWFRAEIDKLSANTGFIIVCIFPIHAAIRFGGLVNPQLYPLAMVFVWPLPWLLLNRNGQQAIGLRQGCHWWWFVVAGVVSLVVVVMEAVLGWMLFGNSSDNWFVSQAHFLNRTIAEMPAETSLWASFWFVTIPAMIFSPLAEEFLYRGFLLSYFSYRWTMKWAMLIQAAAFAIVHLAHYGLIPFQPLLILYWLPSMFLAGLVFGWIAWRSGSLWSAILSHSVFNLGMHVIIFLFLNDIVV